MVKDISQSKISLINVWFDFFDKCANHIRLDVQFMVIK